jgi:pimeloyl-ACP methyl ester carboxylesterase
VPFATHRGQRIHFEVEGKGPTVVFQHGLFSRGRHWKRYGYVDALANDHRVVVVDGLGHGESDKPHDVALYAQPERAGDLVAVFDAIGAERVHLVGYSMGGWIATGVARHHPDRLASLTIGGWDAVGGPSLPAGTRPTIQQVLTAARIRVPDLVKWVTPDVEPALAAAFGTLFEGKGAREALAALRCPVMLWSGDKDTCHGALKALASEHGFTFLETRGDHADAMVLDVPRVSEALRKLFAATT